MDNLGPYACRCTAARKSARYASRIYVKQMARIGVTTTQFSIFNHIRGELTSSAQLAEVMAMDRTTPVRAVQPLLKAGLVESGRASASPRQAWISLTAAGFAKVAAVAPTWRAPKAESESVLGSGHARELRQEFVELNALSNPSIGVSLLSIYQNCAYTQRNRCDQH